MSARTPASPIGFVSASGKEHGLSPLHLSRSADTRRRGHTPAPTCAVCSSREHLQLPLHRLAPQDDALPIRLIAWWRSCWRLGRQPEVSQEARDANRLFGLHGMTARLTSHSTRSHFARVSPLASRAPARTSSSTMESLHPTLACAQASSHSLAPRSPPHLHTRSPNAPTTHGRSSCVAPSPLTSPPPRNAPAAFASWPSSSTRAPPSPSCVHSVYLTNVSPQRLPEVRHICPTTGNSTQHDGAVKIRAVQANVRPRAQFSPNRAVQKPFARAVGTGPMPTSA